MNNLKEAGFKFNKGLGQNFIFDESLLAAIVADLNLTSSDVIVEIGTGAGTLTRVLANKVKNVITFEVDRRLEKILAEQFNERKNIELHFADGLKIADSEILKLTDGAFHVAANIPYYITTPLLLKYMAIPECESISVLIQDDVARRITAAPGSSEYGALSVTMQTYADCKIVRKIPRSVFVPVPNVDSIFIQCKTRDASVNNREIFDKLVKGLFSARRKTILNGLCIVFGFSKEEASEILGKAKIKEGDRPENVSPTQYVQLSNLIHLDRQNKE